MTTDGGPCPATGERSAPLRPTTRLGRVKRRVLEAMDCRSLASLESLGDGRGPIIADVLRRLPGTDLERDCEPVARIEAFRRRWQSSEQPLVDGSLGDGPEWDRGVSLARAVRASKGFRPATLLHLLVQALRPAQVLELGTNVGISAAYVAAALAEQGDRGRLMTLEASPYRLRIARSLHRELGLVNIDYREGLFDQTLEAALEDVPSIDLAFLDGNHRYEPTVRYFEIVTEKAGDRCLVVLDDIRLSEGMRRAWRDIRRHPGVAIAVDLYSMALCELAPAGESGRRRATAAAWLALQHRDLPSSEILARVAGIQR